MSIDLFWTGTAVGAVGMFVMQIFVHKVIYPRLGRRPKR